MSEQSEANQPAAAEERVLLEQALHSYMEKAAARDIMVAFSGGVDSSLLLKAACRAVSEANQNDGGSRRVYAATVHTMLHPSGDRETAARVAAETGAEHLVLEIDELADAGIEENPVDRCYRCKRFLFTRLLKEAEKRKISVILEGTNADDLKVYRPGIRAVRELGVKSPLAELGMTKQQVRMLAESMGISVADRPSAPCLATRFPYGTRLSYEKMRLVDEGERYLKQFGLYNVRLRAHQDTARIETDRESMGILLEHGVEIAGYIKGLGFSYVTLDLEGFRSGSMDIHIQEHSGS